MAIQKVPFKFRPVPEVFIPLEYPGVTPDKYEISNYGTVRNVFGDFEIAQRFNRGGYLQCHLTTVESDNKYTKDYMLHRLVAANFVEENRDLNKEVNHIDGYKTNNSPSNLEWVDHKQNVKHAFETGLVGSCKGENHRHVLSEEDVLKIVERLQDPNVEYKTLGEEFGVAKPTIQFIAQKKNWTHITKDLNIPPRNRHKKKPRYINQRLS